MKTIVIPTNSGLNSQEHFKLAVNLFNEEVTCLFLQIRPIPDNYNDMMTLHKHMSKYQCFTQPFIRSMNLLKEQYGDKVTIKTDYIYGDSSAVFRNYINYHDADLVIYDKNEWQDIKTKTGLNIFRMVSRCGCELMYVSKDNTLSGIGITTTPNRETANAPDSVLYQYNAIEKHLDGLEDAFNNNKIVSKKINNVSRYFLNESIMQKMLVQSDCSLLLLKN